MQFELWGATGTPLQALALALPERPLGYWLLSLYALLLLYALFRERTTLARTTLRQWILTVLLGIISLAASQFFLVFLHFDDQLAAYAMPQNPGVHLALLGSIPFLLAAATLNPAAALLVGFSSGLGRALWQTHHLFDPFHFALTAYLAAGWLRQNYHGRLYNLLRRPLLAGPLASLMVAPLAGLAAYAYADLASSDLAALDLALSSTRAALAALIVEGLLAGLIVELLLIGVPVWRQRRQQFVAAPASRSLRRRLLNRFVLAAAPVMLLLITAVFGLATRLATQLVVSQMAQDAAAVAAQLPDYRSYRQNLLNEFSQNPDLLASDPVRNQAALSRLFRSGDLFRRVILLDAEGNAQAFFPDDAPSLTLTDLERTAVARTLNSGAPSATPAQLSTDGAHIMSFVSPVVEDGQTVGALVGRVPDIAFDNLIVGLQGTVGEGVGFIVDENDRIIAHPSKAALRKAWSPTAAAQRTIDVGAAVPGRAYEGRSPETNARELVYYRLGGAGQPWTVVITVPYEVVLRLALQIGLPLTAVLLTAVAFFAVALGVLGQSITRPVIQLLQASQSIAGGSLDTPIQTEGDDELGQLGQAFETMQRSLKRRLDDLALLVNVSQSVTASLNIDHGMPAILQGAVRGAGAAGARAVVLNPLERYPLNFGEGPFGEEMSRYDRVVTGEVRRRRELILSRPEAVQEVLGANAPYKALLAIGLQSHGRFQGIFWLAFHRPHTFDTTELNLVRTLASQASVLVENARLFASASSGRRRLAAVLASTTDAVIVTDQTEQVLLINPAMERAFGLTASAVIGHAVHHVVEDESLLGALTSNERVRNLEVVAPNGRTYYVNASPISSDGQAMGRVAVLHDITQLKEIDEMKSEFVSTVSHDLRGPLSYMRGYTTMLEMVGEVNEQQDEYVQKILAGIDQMTTLVNDLLDLGRIESGMRLNVGEVSIDSLLAGVAIDHKQPARAQGIDIIVDAPAELPAIQGDKHLLRQAITNLVSNAIKYAPESGRIVLRAFVQNGHVVVGVADRGPGISEEDQLRLFEKFYRVKQRGTARVKGSGLGLAIVKSIAERHGGRAWCRSQEGQGSTFYVALPLNGNVRGNE